MFPKFIQIQTSSYCNGICPYCPYPELKSELEMGLMNMGLAKNLVRQAVNGGVDRIVPYLMNEPLLDGRIYDLLKYIRNLSDDVWIEISTNAKTLMKNQRKALARYENMILLLNINGYTKLKNVKAMLEEPHRCNVVGVLYVDYMSKYRYDELKHLFAKNHAKCYPGIVDDRAGNVDLDDGLPRYERGHCFENRLTEWMHILWNGDAIICCQDWQRSYVLGNANQQSLEEIFNGPAYHTERQFKPAICRRCARWIPRF